MKKLLWLLPLACLLFASPVWAADLQWDHTDVGIADGYVIYFNETSQTDTPYNKTMLKSALTVNVQTLTLVGFEPVLNLQIGQAYDIWVTAYNVLGQSGPSNTVQHTITAYTPPTDSLPSGAQIIIPNGPVMIRIP